MKSLPPELPAKIDEIKLWMFEGDQKEVDRRAKTFETRVSQVLNKRIAPNKTVLEKAIEVMNENRVRFQISNHNSNSR